MESGEKNFNNGEQHKITEIAKGLNVVLKSPDSAKNLVAGMDVSARELLLEALFSQKEVRDEAKRQENKESFLERYKVQLENIDKILVQIRSLNWTNTEQIRDSGKITTIGGELKKLFFRFLNENEENNSLKLYIKELNQINNPDKILSGNLKHDFMVAFSEIFRLYAYTKIELYRSVLEKVDFPFSKFEQTLDDFKNFFKQEYDLEFIVPNLYIEKVNPELHTNGSSTSHIRSRYLIDMRDFEENIESGTIYDFNAMGLKSKRLGIDEKAKACLYSRV